MCLSLCLCPPSLTGSPPPFLHTTLQHEEQRMEEEKRRREEEQRKRDEEALALETVQSKLKDVRACSVTMMLVLVLVLP